MCTLGAWSSSQCCECSKPLGPRTVGTSWLMANLRGCKSICAELGSLSFLHKLWQRCDYCLPCIRYCAWHVSAKQAVSIRGSASTAASWPSSACTKQGRCLTTRTRRPRHTLVELTSAQLLQSVQPQAAQLLPSQHLHRGLAHGRRLVRASSNPPAKQRATSRGGGKVANIFVYPRRLLHVFVMCLCVYVFVMFVMFVMCLCVRACVR